MKNSFPDFLNDPADEVARKLLGCEIERTIDGENIRVRIVETESYDQDDEASHAFGGERKRNATMFKESGHLYVYFTYGMHYCCNIVTGQPGYGSGVLIRAVEPIIGKGLLEQRRGIIGVNATNGPAKACKALGIDLNLNGHDLHQDPMRLIAGILSPNESVVVSQRIGISKARDAQRRFYIKDNQYVSHTKKVSS